MKRAEKAVIIAQQLEELYPEIPVPLDHSNPFELLVAVLMSAQTTDLKVNEVTPALFAKASNAATMATLPVETILADIRQVGLAPTKAKNIRRLSEMLVERHGGEVPASFEALKRCRAWATKRPVWSWPRRSVCRLFPLTPTSIVWPRVGGSPTAPTWRRPSGT